MRAGVQCGGNQRPTGEAEDQDGGQRAGAESTTEPAAWLLGGMWRAGRSAGFAVRLLVEHGAFPLFHLFGSRCPLRAFEEPSGGLLAERQTLPNAVYRALVLLRIRPREGIEALDQALVRRR